MRLLSGLGQNVIDDLSGAGILRGVLHRQPRLFASSKQIAAVLILIVVVVVVVVVVVIRSRILLGIADRA